MNHDDTHPYSIHGKPNWHDQIHAELDPYAQPADHTAEITAITPPGAYGARPEKVGLALARIIDLVEAHQDAGEADDLDKYIAGFTPGPQGTLAQHLSGVPAGYEPGHNRFANYPLANLGTHAEQDKEVRKAAATLTRGGAS